MPLTPRPGDRPVPDYELVRQIGAGGFGEVWQARGPGGIDVALKFIRLDAHGSELELRSLDVMKSIRHPNLVCLFGVWRTDQLLILALELCDRSLQNRLNEALQQNLPGIPLRELLGYMRGAADGLDALHDNGVQHRDVKPGNLLLLQKGVKVADFGLAKVLDHTAASHTGAMTVSYAAPEFFKDTTSQQSDQYSLAATYVHLRTGHLLFEGSYHQVAHGHMDVQPDLSRLSVAEQIVVARALAKEPERRWPTCEMFVNELNLAHTSATSKLLQAPKKEGPPQPQRAGKQVGAAAELLAQPTILPPSPESRLDSAATELRQAETPDQTRGNGWLWPLLVGLLLLVLVSCGVVGVQCSGMELFSKGTRTDANDTARDKVGMDSPNPGIESTKLPPTLTVDLGSGVKMEFVLIDPKSKPDGGKFKMGSPPDEQGRNPYINQFDAEKQHDVELTKPYYLGKYVVTQEQYQQMTGDNPSWYRQGHDGADKVRDLDTNQFPVERVNWYKADSFCDDLTKKCGNQLPAELRQKGNRFALPTEAQWEYACRAGTKTRYFFGDNEKQLGAHAWFKDNSGDRTHAVTEKDTSNPWGLYDMHGNVYQWCRDYYDAKYYAISPVKDPFNGKESEPVNRVIRGSSWLADPTYCRAAIRGSVPPGFGLNDIGLRVCIRPD